MNWYLPSFLWISPIPKKKNRRPTTRMAYLNPSLGLLAYLDPGAGQFGLEAIFFQMWGPNIVLTWRSVNRNLPFHLKYPKIVPKKGQRWRMAQKL